MPPPSRQKSRSHGKAPTEGETETGAVQWATVTLKMAVMSVGEYEQGSEEKEVRKIFLKGKEVRKNSEEEM
jgi:hypothetical protein